MKVVIRVIELVEIKTRICIFMTFSYHFVQLKLTVQGEIRKQCK